MNPPRMTNPRSAVMRSTLLALALLAVFIVAPAASAKGGTGQVSIAATSSCDAGWTINAAATSQSPLAVLHADLLDDHGLLAADVPLSYNQPYRYTAAASGRRDTLTAFVHNSIQQLGRLQIDNPCGVSA